MTPSPSSGTSPATPYLPSINSNAHRFVQAPRNLHLSGPPPNSRSSRVPAIPSSSLNPLQLASPRFKRQGSVEIPFSPDSRRRRLADGTHVSVRASNAPPAPFSSLQGRRESLPRPDFMPAKGNNPFTMAPPPRPVINSNSQSHPDGSLTLPPLITSPKTWENQALKQAKSLEAMIMSIPAANKIRLLAKIAPPLPPPGLASPTRAVRGFVVAIDGADDEGLKLIMQTLRDSLEPSHPVRQFAGPPKPLFSFGKDTPARQGEAGLRSHLQIISYYHLLSKDIIAWITGQTNRPAADQPDSAVSPKTITYMGRDGMKGPAPQSQAAGSNAPPSLEASSVSTASTPDPAETANPRATHETPLPGIPIALVPGYQLTHTDAAAMRIPITDSYAPIDHWQWMATLWRGIIGPDVTIAIEPPTRYPSTNSAGDSAGKPTGANVEIRLEDARAVVVKGAWGNRELRRVGFEVSEWIQSREEGRRGS